MDALVRSWPLLLICACAPAKGEPVGVSSGGTDRRAIVDAAVDAPRLEGLPADFRTSWTRTARAITSEHGHMTADVFEGDASFAEDLFAGDAGQGIYLLEQTDAGTRFGVADPGGHAIVAPVDLCARCHASARDGVFPIVR